MKEVMKYFILEQYNLVLIRYGEVWLKSQKVKIRMLNHLMSNLKNMLQKKGIPFHKYQLSKDSSRIFFFFENEVLHRALDVIQKVFGIHSFSPALRTSNKIKNITERTLEVAGKILKKNDTFALRVKRSGIHDYDSLELARIVGKKVIDAFSEFNLKVNLSNPQKKIFIEVRDDFSYIFTHIYETKWAGLPIEGRKNILVMDVGRLEDLMAGFLLMRRGSNIHPLLLDMSDDKNNFDKWLSNWKEVLDYFPFKKFRILKIKLTSIFDKILSNLKQNEFKCAICRLLRYNIISNVIKDPKFRNLREIRAFTDGLRFANSSFCTDEIDLQSISLNYLFSNYPVFTPLIGFSKEEFEEKIRKLSENLIRFDYCKYQPKNQIFNKQDVQLIYNNLKIRQDLEKITYSIEIIDLKD
jgi:thiamine biosynthesis protein ThiI